MDRPAPIASFAEVMAWLRTAVRTTPALGRLQLMTTASGAPRSALLMRDRARLAIVEAGRAPPEAAFDVLILCGAAETLGSALPRLPAHRVHAVTLPTLPALLQRAVEEGIRAAQTVLQGRVADQLIDVGLALNRERDPRRVLELILRHARAITGADAGSVYVVEDDGRRLVFRVAHNDSVAADFAESTMPVSDASIVGACVRTGEIINIPDLSQETAFSHDRSFDARFNYLTRSMLTVPMRAPEGQVVGAVQLINAKHGRMPLRDPEDTAVRVHSFSDADARLVQALATQGAVALENVGLYAEIEALFEGFVRASVTAIEQRDPTTSGHSQRVADLTVALAQVVDATQSPDFRAYTFTRQELREIEYAGLLHDFGKVGVREQVLVKAKKLHQGQLDRVLERFEHLRTATRLRWLEGVYASGRRPDDPAALATLYAEFARIDGWRDVVLQANEPTLLMEQVGQAVHEVAGLRFHDGGGRELAILDDELLAALLVSRGSLTVGEREEVESHVRHTYNFLIKIPWGRALARVPEIAAKHHEYLNGTGYPGRLPALDIPIQARLMTVADIFDALTAADRPYKRAVPVVRALDILHSEADAGKVDRAVLELFIEARVYERVGLRIP